MLREFLECVLSWDEPDREIAALFLACCWLRGFDMREEKAGLWTADAAAWVRRHGQPTAEKLLAWVDELGIEAEVPAKLALRNLNALLDELAPE